MVYIRDDAGLPLFGARSVGVGMGNSDGILLARSPRSLPIVFP